MGFIQKRYILYPFNWIWLMVYLRITVPLQLFCFYSNSLEQCIQTHLHLLIPTLELPANHGSITNTHRNVVASSRPRKNEGLSWSRSPLRNQCRTCFSLITGRRVVLLCVSFVATTSAEVLALESLRDEVVAEVETAAPEEGAGIGNFSPVIMTSLSKGFSVIASIELILQSKVVQWIFHFVFHN